MWHLLKCTHTQYFVMFQSCLTVTVTALSRHGLFHVQSFLFSWVGIPLATRMCKKIPHIRVALRPFCSVIIIPPISMSKDGTLSRLKNIGQYGSVSLFVITIMLLHFGVCLSQCTGRRPIQNGCWNHHIHCRHMTLPSLCCYSGR